MLLVERHLSLPFMSHFNLTKQYYSFDYQNVHFIAMSTELPWTKSSAQYKFVKDDLLKASIDPNIGWIIVFYHDLAYTSPSVKHAKSSLRDTYHPLFEQYNVDLVLQAHQHNYQRTYPIKYNSDTPINPIITDRNTDTYTNPEGQIYLTVGTGGAALHSLNGNQAPYIVTAQDDVYGFLNLDVAVNSGGTTLVGTFYSNDDGAGEMTDQFTITKSGEEDSSLLPPPPPPPPDLPIQQTDGIEEADTDETI